MSVKYSYLAVIEVVSVNRPRNPNGVLLAVIVREVTEAVGVNALKNRSNVLERHWFQRVHVVTDIDDHVAILGNNWGSSSEVRICHWNSAVEFSFARIPVKSVELEVSSKRY